ncbi:MAG: hypothetical protein ACRD8U_02735, partial [Pyrinomonadaceae bacterium]
MLSSRRYPKQIKVAINIEIEKGHIPACRGGDRSPARLVQLIAAKLAAEKRGRGGGLNWFCRPTQDRRRRILEGDGWI